MQGLDSTLALARRSRGDCGKKSRAVIPCELCCDYNDNNATCDIVPTQVSAGNVTKARSVVEKGRLRNPGNELLWMKAVSCKTFLSDVSPPDLVFKLVKHAR